MKNIAFLCVILALTGCKPDETVLHGYVEGEYVYISPTTSGILRTLFVERGQKVESAAALFALDDTELNASLASAEADVAKAQAQFNNLLKGQRPEEIEVILKQKEQAKASLEHAKKEYERAKVLVGSSAISRSDYDGRETEYKSSKANLDALEAQIKVATLGARKDEIEASQATLEMARQHLIQVKKQLSDAAPKAPTASYVENTFYRAGEYVPAGKAVVSLLPPENIKVRFFVSQKLLPTISQGKKIMIGCDGCAKPIEANVSFISSQAEYTPPVIYSTESRDKLVYMVEATPIAADVLLRPGLPVDIRTEMP
jgi:HlyD family secretion protein